LLSSCFAAYKMSNVQHSAQEAGPLREQKLAATHRSVAKLVQPTAKLFKDTTAATRSAQAASRKPERYALCKVGLPAHLYEFKIALN